MRGRHTLAAASGALCLLLVSACGGSGEPQPLPRPTAKPSPTESTSPAPPVMPSAAKQKSKAGAEASVRHFLMALNYAGATGDTAEFAASYASTCTRCQAIADGIQATYAAGGSIEGGSWVPTKVKFYSIKGDVAYLDALVDYEPQTIIQEAGGQQSTSPARKNVLKTFQLSWDGSRWRVGALDPTT